MTVQGYILGLIVALATTLYLFHYIINVTYKVNRWRRLLDNMVPPLTMCFVFWVLFSILAIALQGNIHIAFIHPFSYFYLFSL